jgi:probable rRNA maturation factor
MSRRAAPRLTLDFVRLAGAWRMQKKLAVALDAILPDLLALTGKLPPGNYGITIALTDDAQQKALNHQFRGINKPTNVLSFPQYTPRQLRTLKPGKEPIFLGDIAMAYQYMVSEAKKDHKILISHTIHLAIHGILHILGYDHQTARQATVMENLERAILDAMHIPDPYAPPPVTAVRPMQRSRRP